MNRQFALGAVVGPLVFISTWLIAGVLRDGYDPVNQAISELADLEAPNRWIVTTGMCVFGIGCLLFSTRLSGPAQISLAIAGVSALAVAAFPCSGGCPGAVSGNFTDKAHVVAATIQYVSLALTPLLLGRTPFNIAAFAIGGLALAMQGAGIGPNGMMQRIGLTVLDIWLMATAWREFVAPNDIS